MRHARFTIGGLMALVVVMGIGFAALRSPTALWDSALFTTVWIVLGTATLGAFHFRGRTRASWAGFAAFGFAYLAMVSGPWSLVILPRLTTTMALDQLDAQIRPRKPQQFGGTLMLSQTGNLNGTATYTIPQVLMSGSTSISAQNIQIWTLSQSPLALNFVYFLPIGHNLWTLIIAILGGMVGGSLYGCAESRREDEARIDHLRRIEATDLSLPGTIAKVAEKASTSGHPG